MPVVAAFTRRDTIDFVDVSDELAARETLGACVHLTKDVQAFAKVGTVDYVIESGAVVCLTCKQYRPRTMQELLCYRMY